MARCWFAKPRVPLIDHKSITLAALDQYTVYQILGTSLFNELRQISNDFGSSTHYNRLRRAWDVKLLFPRTYSDHDAHFHDMCSTLTDQHNHQVLCTMLRLYTANALHAVEKMLSLPLFSLALFSFLTSFLDKCATTDGGRMLVLTI